MARTPTFTRHGRHATALALATLLLAGCGGGDSQSGIPLLQPVDCSLAAQKTGLRNYMQDWYLFTPNNPALAGYPTIEAYFQALLAAGDRWSFVEPTATFTQFFDAGQSLGYGLSVAGRTEDPLPVRVRYIAPGSPAEVAGLRRGMIIDSINGRAASSFKTDPAGFSPLTPDHTGQTVQLGVRDTAGSAVRTLILTASVYDLKPVAQTRSFTSGNGRQVAYLHYKDFISSGDADLANFLKTQSDQGAQELILDLRYNGGGRVAIANDLATSIGPNTLNGAVFAALSYNSAHQDRNYNFRFGINTSGWRKLNLPRVYVLTGPRTCSASELVVNGLAPFANVVQIGSGTCGKPYGFNPVDMCGNTYSAINFESRNAAGAGGYVSGLSPSSGCTVADDFDHALGDPAEALTAAALRHIATGSCQASGSSQVQPYSVQPTSPAGLTPAEGERRPGALLLR